MTKKAEITRLTEGYLKKRTELRERVSEVMAKHEYSPEYKNELKAEVEAEAQELLTNYKIAINEIVGAKRQELEALGVKEDGADKEKQILKEMQLSNIYKEIELSGKYLDLKDIANRMQGLDAVSNRTIKAILRNQGIDSFKIEESLPVDTEEATSKKLYNIENHIRRLTTGIGEGKNPVLETGLMGLEHTLNILDDDLNYIA